MIIVTGYVLIFLSSLSHPSSMTMDRICRALSQSAAPEGAITERVIQFGEGNFLRGFAEPLIEQANRAGCFGGSVVALQPIANGLVDRLNDQDGLYTLILRGQRNGLPTVEHDVITCVSRGLRCVDDWEEVLACAASPTIEVVISNTTEAGISYDPDDSPDLTPPTSFPGKLCVYLHHRFEAFGGDPTKGMLILPCELIDRNGENLCRIVLQLADEWKLGNDFSDWIRQSCTFANTLVDRIVTGYPGADEARAFSQEWGYADELIVTAEPFQLWVIEGPVEAAERFPVHLASPDVIWVDDMTPYRTRKVRILNGAHTASMAASYLSGIEHVRGAVEDEVVGSFMRAAIFDEIIPTLDMPRPELEAYAAEVLDRFQNPFIKHRWLDISLNSISKYRARVLPSLLNHLERDSASPCLEFSLAATIAFYRGQNPVDGVMPSINGAYVIRDDQSVLEVFSAGWKAHSTDMKSLSGEVIRQKDLWGIDLTAYESLIDRLAHYLEAIGSQGVREALREVVPARRDRADVA